MGEVVKRLYQRTGYLLSTTREMKECLQRLRDFDTNVIICRVCDIYTGRITVHTIPRCLIPHSFIQRVSKDMPSYLSDLAGVQK